MGRLSLRIRLGGLTLLAMIAGAAGCSTGPGRDGGYTAPATAVAPPAGTQADKPGANGVVGVWQGTTLASCNTSSASRCNAQQDVTLTLIQGDKGLGGFYRCAYLTQNCYNMNETGKIVRATLSGTQITMRVQMPDGSSCVFTGRTPNGDVNGGYTCYNGGAILEGGSWRAHRQY